MRRSTVVLLPDAEEGGYTVEVPELPGCVTEGDTIEEALAMVKDAIEGWIGSMIEAGEDVPEESIPVIVTSVDVEDRCEPATETAARERERGG